MGEQNNNKETTLNDVLSSVNDLAEAVNIFATKTEERFDKIETNISEIKTDISAIKTDISGLKGEIISIKSQMVTKDYLDTKMADLRGDLVILLRKEDIKVKTLLEILLDKKLITQEDKNKVMALEPFPQLAL